MLHYDHKIEDLRSPPANRLEALRGHLKGFHSIRVNDQWRIVFRWTPDGPEDVDVLDARRDPARRISAAVGDESEELADHLRCDVKVINRIVNGRTSVTAEMALKLGASFRTSPDFWLNAQKAVDVYQARAHLRRLPKPLLAAS